MVAWLVVWPLFPSISLAKPLQQQDSPDDFGPDAIWDPFDGNTPGGMEARNCYFSGTEPLNCILSVMQGAEAPQQAIEFVEMTNGEAFMVLFKETGNVDVAGVVYPGRANSNFQYMLINGAQPMVRADADYLHEAISSSFQDNPVYLSLLQTSPDVSLWIWDNKFEGAQELPSGGQRFIFSYLLRDGCHACDVLAYAFVAFNFNSAGEFEDVNLVTLATPEKYESTRLRFQADVASFDGQVGGISYIGEDGNLWIVDTSDNQQQPLTQISAGKIVAYDWSSEGNKIVYVKETGGEKTDIHLLDVGDAESELLLSNVNYNPWGGIAFSPSGEEVAFTSNIVDIEVLDVRNKSSATIFHADVVGLGAGIPRTKRGLNWSADGKYLAADMYATGSVVLSMGDNPEPEIQFLSTKHRANPTFAPSEPKVAWVDWTEGQKALIITDVEGNSLARIPVSNCDLGPNTSLSWMTSGNTIAMSHAEGLCIINVEAGTVTNLIPGQSTWNARWSSDSEWILFRYVEGIGTMGVVEQTIGMVSSSGSDVIDLGVYGSMPSWADFSKPIDASSLVSRKEATIPRLENTSVDIVGVPFQVKAFDESAARSLLSTIEQSVEDGSLDADHAEAFARATYQEEALAELLPMYTQASADMTEMAVDVAGLIFASLDKSDTLLDKAAESGSRFSKGWVALQRMIGQKLLSILDGLIRNTIHMVPDAEEQQAVRQFWDLLITGIRMQNFAEEDALNDLLLGNVVKQPCVSHWIRQYVKQIQPSLDQGARSADPNYTGTSGVWNVEGEAKRAEFHMESVVHQGQIESEYAHNAHRDLMKGVDRAQLITDIADLATLSPVAGWAKLTSIASKIMNALVDTAAFYVNWRSMDCVGYLSSRAGDLAFNPNQPGESCRDRSGRFIPETYPHLARAMEIKGDTGAWQSVWSKTEVDIEAYEDAVNHLLATTQERDPQAVSQALVKLEKADRELMSSTNQTLALILNSDVEAEESISRSNKFLLDALELYLRAAAFLAEPKEPKHVAEVEQAAVATLSSLKLYEHALKAGAPTKLERKPLPIIQAVDYPDSIPAGSPIEVQVVIQNVGSVNAESVMTTLQFAGHTAQEIDVGTLASDQAYTTNQTLQASSDYTDTLPMFVTVMMSDSVIDSRLEYMRVNEESESKTGGLPGICLGLAGIILLPLSAAALRTRTSRISFSD
jgi:Tol biopolymer transport system component